jgi:hypothetical protein
MTTSSCAPNAAASSLAVSGCVNEPCARLDRQAAGADARERLAARQRRDLVAGAGQARGDQPADAPRPTTAILMAVPVERLQIRTISTRSRSPRTVLPAK